MTTFETAAPPRAELRAREPDRHGYAAAPDGLRLFWEVYGTGSTTLVLLPPNPISHSRIWKAQIHYLARHHRVVAYDGRGNGRSDAPDPAGVWPGEWYLSDCLTVMDGTGTDAAVLVGICGDGVWPSVQLAADQPQRVRGIVALAPDVPMPAPPHPWRAAALETIDEQLSDPQGWEKLNNHYIRENYRGFLEFFFGEMFPEPRSTKHIEDAVAYGLDGPVEALLMEQTITRDTREEIEEVCARVRCPVLVVHENRDNCQPPERGRRLAELTGAEHVELVGAGHIPNVRHPVLINRLIDDFVARLDVGPPRRRTWTRGSARTIRALLISSPIGLGHAWRDVAIARELRRRVPGLDVQWLAQPPVTALLEQRRETVHPASAELASEAAGVDAEVGEHEQFLAADYNAQMVEHIARHPRLRDLSIFIGDRYFPLKHHFERSFHVHHRLERHRAGRRMDFDDSPPEAIAWAIAQEIGREVDYRPVATDGAKRAAAGIVELLE